MLLGFVLEIFSKGENWERGAERANVRGMQCGDCESISEHLSALKKSLERYVMGLGLMDTECARLHRYGSVSPVVEAHEALAHLNALKELGDALALAVRNEPAVATQVLHWVTTGSMHAGQLKLNSAMYRDLQLESEKAVYHLYGLLSSSLSLSLSFSDARQCNAMQNNKSNGHFWRQR